MTIICTLLSGCGSDIDKVKDGVLDFNKTITVGQALDKWSSCENKDWKTFSTDNGIKVVEFTCHHKLNDFFIKLKSIVPKKVGKDPIYLDVVNNLSTFQFTLNKDDTFQINTVETQNTWADGSKYKDSRDPIEALENVYENELIFDQNAINSQTAEAFAFAFAMIKPGEKYIISSPVAVNPSATNNTTDNENTIKPAGRTVKCDIKSNGSSPFHGDCNFLAESGGSFTLGNVDSTKPITEDIASVNVYITGLDIAEVSGLTTGGIISKWGTAKRSTKDRACWSGEDFEICAR